MWNMYSFVFNSFSCTNVGVNTFAGDVQHGWLCAPWNFLPRFVGVYLKLLPCSFLIHARFWPSLFKDLNVRKKLPNKHNSDQIICMMICISLVKRPCKLLRRYNLQVRKKLVKLSFLSYVMLALMVTFLWMKLLKLLRTSFHEMQFNFTKLSCPLILLVQQMVLFLWRPMPALMLHLFVLSLWMLLANIGVVWVLFSFVFFGIHGAAMVHSKFTLDQSNYIF